MPDPKQSQILPILSSQILRQIVKTIEKQTENIDFIRKNILLYPMNTEEFFSVFQPYFRDFLGGQFAQKTPVFVGYLKQKEGHSNDSSDHKQ